MTTWGWLNQRLFSAVHGNNLIYNACWEDPRLDREALQAGPRDTLLVITSAGCNALDYALDGPKRIHAVDVNSRQNALLELKIAGIRSLDFEDFFSLFGLGGTARPEHLYRRAMRQHLPDSARAFWDSRIHFFRGSEHRPSFYFRGTTGYVAHAVNWYIDRVAKIRDSIDAMLAADTIETQRDVYYSRVHGAFWTKFVRWMCGRDASLSLLGVPRAQRDQIDRQHNGGVAQFIEECLEAVFACLPLGDNYFWRVYLCGRYTAECCPEYLKADNFTRLKDGLVDCIDVHTSTVEDFLRAHNEPVSRYVLLDHMDWMSATRRDDLQREWQAIVDRAAPNARVLWRSAGLDVDFVDPLGVTCNGRQCMLGQLLHYYRDWATALHARDRVHTYGSFYIADLLTV